MKSTQYNRAWGLNLSKDVQMERIRKVIQEELTPFQREILTAYYFQEQTIPQIALDRRVNKSTVSRTLRRAEKKLRRYLVY